MKAQMAILVVLGLAACADGPNEPTVTPPSANQAESLALAGEPLGAKELAELNTARGSSYVSCLFIANYLGTAYNETGNGMSILVAESNGTMPSFGSYPGAVLIFLWNPAQLPYNGFVANASMYACYL
jgi:hypothetical protein